MPQKIRDPNWMTHLWQRVLSMFGGLDTRVSDIETASYIPASQKGAAGGVAELDSGGHVPSSQLPSYVDDVLEYSTRSAFPATGEAGKIYIALDTNITYRWGGSAYVEIASSLALGETSSTAYRGDRGKIAYDHAQAKGSAFASGLYKITTNAEGHVTGATAVTKQDIMDLGIPGEAATVEVITNAQIDEIIYGQREGVSAEYWFASSAAAHSVDQAEAETTWSTGALSYQASAGEG